MIRGTVAGMRAFRSVRTPAALLAALALGGCAAVSPGPPRSAATRPLPGYARRADALAAGARPAPAPPERVRLANAFAPDLFVSIHHNADARGAHDVNETQTYYKLGDEGPSLEAAESGHRFLGGNLGIRAQRIVPRHFFVQRSR